MKRLRWGILSTAKIGTQKVIPGMLKSNLLEVSAIASRSIESAQKAASDLRIPQAYGSYEELISDPEIDIIYNPLPNHLHVDWTSRAIETGKHVLCEKPLFLNPNDGERLIKLREKHDVVVGEAFMVESHPQWQRAKELVVSGTLGHVRAYQASFSYFNDDPENIRNIPAYGGGALWDIGCYGVMTACYLLGKYPNKVCCTILKDEQFGTDILSTAVLQFEAGVQASFTVSTQAAPYQRVHVLGTKKELEIHIPFNAPPDRTTSLQINDSDVLLERVKTEYFDICDQYQLQAEDFCRAVNGEAEVPVDLETAVMHSRIITGLFRSADKGEWITP